MVRCIYCTVATEPDGWHGCNLGHHPQRAGAEAPETSAEDRVKPYREDTIEGLGQNPGAH